MPRANRYFLPGYAWHITHRCHKKDFLLKFARDRRSWMSWLFEAKKRYRLRVLNYMATSNHIHLLVFDSGERESFQSRCNSFQAGQLRSSTKEKRERGPSGKIAIMRPQWKRTIILSVV